jgi:hypothetical protein
MNEAYEREARGCCGALRKELIEEGESGQEVGPACVDRGCEVGGDDTPEWPVCGDPIHPVSHLQRTDDISMKELRCNNAVLAKD